ncbi:MAG TPA: helix-turn-helix domain-containing protein [Allosphingosinicella sp.]|nr:helix-turn-helix domain-containing protein [Allosphingosinicella sp.]
MDCEFTIMERQLEAPRSNVTEGKLVLSRLKPGSSPIGTPSPSVKLVLQGEQRYEIDGRTIAMRPGEFLYLDAGSACIGTNRTEMTGLCLLLPHAKAEAGVGGGEGHDPVLGRSLVLSTRASAMGRILTDYARRIASDPGLGPTLAGELVARVQYAIAEPLEESRAAIEGLKAAKPSTRRELYRRLERARGFLHEHDDRSVTLSEMASVAGLSQFHLARYFKSAFGSSPISYHRGLRLARAAELLAQGGRSIAEVAEATGYSDQVALSHAFRRHYGAPPHLWSMRRKAS